MLKGFFLIFRHYIIKYNIIFQHYLPVAVGKYIFYFQPNINGERTKTNPTITQHPICHVKQMNLKILPFLSKPLLNPALPPPEFILKKRKRL